MPERVAFIGLGNMGYPMAKQLVDGGVKVAGYDIDPNRSAAFARHAGAKKVESVEQAVRQSDIVITMLPGSKLVEDTIGLAKNALTRGALLIDMTSGIPMVTRRLADFLNPVGVSIIDAPVSGGVGRAQTGDLSIMTGGDPADCGRADPLLRLMGSTITHVGALGAGQAMKALNNLVSAGGFLIGVEALLIGKRFGLDPSKMVDVFNASTGMNNSTQKKLRQFVLSRAFNAGFSLELMVKDLSIALEIARDGDATAPFSALCREMWSGASKSLGPGADHTAMAVFSEQLAGMALA